ncbi:MAG: carbohydrate binding domain-containing protein [Polyangiaceae bacterium]
MKLSRLGFPALLLTLLDCGPFAPEPGHPPQQASVGSTSHAATGSWLALDQTSDAPSPQRLKLDDAIVGTFFDDDVSKPGGYTYAYGDKTRNKVLPSTSSGNAAVFATYFGDDYSGVNISLGAGKYLDLTPYRKTGSLTFWIKGGRLAQKFMVGLMDSQGGIKKVQSKVIGDSYVVVQSGEWTQCRIPLKAFIDDGMYWDAAQQREVGAKLDWSKITDFRISINRGENKVAEGAPVAFYLDQIQVTKTSKGVPDPDAFWNAFHSDAPEQLVTDFSKSSEKWRVQHGKSAEISASFAKLPAGAPSGVKGQTLKLDFKPGDWFDAFIRPESAPGMPTDWSKHYGLSVWLYTEKPYQSFDFVIYDRNSEMFTARVGATRGWHEILIPFRSFAKFPYYQPPEAKQNNQLDLDGVVQFGIKPGGEVAGAMYLANVRVTNRREVKQAKAAPLLLAKFSGNSRKTLQKVPDIYGINAALYAPDFLDPRSAAVERALGMGVVRYPGGLRADEEDWQKTLLAKDARVDTNEFLDWCEGMRCTPMFTANVGDGTPESAAAWVKYVNQTRQGPKVKLWEIGNEIYGDWHPSYAKWGKDGGTKYGKAVRAYVQAMKAVDPSIKVSAVWMLGGAWNRAVFKEVADVVDAVSVHHYPQNAGSESDLGLLAASSEADALMRDVQKQVQELGVHGRAYEIWLTEWNSVDANPNAQIMQHVNALFIADYLGHLAQSPIQIANLWALYNGRDKRLGDYSVLAPASDPQGFNFRRPSYWGFEMMANTLTGTLLSATTDQEALSGWLCKHEDGRLALIFVNKSFESDFQTALSIPGLSGSATISVLSAETSGGLLSADAFGKTHPSTGPQVERREIADGSTILVPKASIVTVTY